MEHLTPQTPPIHQNAAKKDLRRQVLHPVRNPADAFLHVFPPKFFTNIAIPGKMRYRKIPSCCIKTTLLVISYPM
jgi:hypothetical protein